MEAWVETELLKQMHEGGAGAKYRDFGKNTPDRE